MDQLTKPDKAHWQRLSALLDDVLTLPQNERSSWLSSLPAEDADLLPTLRIMLTRTSVETDTFLANPIPLHQFLPKHAVRHEDAPGDYVGPYQLIEQIGTGGMGTVWLSERIDGSPKRQVALKLPHVDRASGLAERMRREGNILATLEHQNIARLYDAGVTVEPVNEDGIIHEGRPYLAMEYVHGQPIDVFCEKRKLDIPGRLRLFVQVTRAVAHAHTRLVVHRDLKPSNILVAKNGDVKLLDFGVAKLLANDDDASKQATQFTQIMGRALTPDYASPEQIRGESIGVASDVYSLGVVLYELLSGKRPYKLKRDSIAALEEAITEAVIPFASTVAERKRARVLRGDLDTILAKTLKKSVARRYHSVDALAADLARFLVGKPVLAQKDSRAYRWRKFVGRHLGSILTALLVVIALGTTSGIAIWQAHIARDEAARATAVKRYMASIFTSATPKEGVGGLVTAFDLLSAAASRVENELADNPEVAAEVGIMIAEGFSNLGDPAKGEVPLVAAVARAEKTLGKQHPLTIRGKLLLSTALMHHDLKRALELVLSVIPDADAGLPATAKDLVTAHSNHSFILAKFNQANESYVPLQKSIGVARRYLGDNDELTISQIGFLSNTFGRFGDWKLQLESATEANRRAQQTLLSKRPHRTLTNVERWYADALRNNDRPKDSLPIFRRVLVDQLQLDAANTLRVRHARHSLARALVSIGQLPEALPIAREVVEMELQQNPIESDDRAAYASFMTDILLVARLTDEALLEDTRTQGVYERLGTQTEKGIFSRLIRRAQLLAMSGDHNHATSMAADAESRASGSFPELGAEALLVLATNARLQNKHSEALQALKMIEKNPKLDSLRQGTQSAIAAELGTVLLEINDINGAAAAIAKSTELYQHAQIDPSVRVATCLIGQARLHLQGGRAREAEVILAPLLKQWAEINPNSPWHGETLYWTARAQEKMGKTDEARQNLIAATSMLKKSNLPALKKLVAK